MKRFIALALVISFALTGCQSSSIGVIGGADGPTAILIAEKSKKSKKSNNESAPSNGYTDFLGETVTVKSTDRIISTSPTITEILYELGVGNNIVGVDVYSYYPKEAANVAKVGGLNGLDIETIISLDPDIVFTGTNIQSDAVDALRKFGLTVISAEATSFDQIYASIRLIAQIVGKKEQGMKIIENIESAKKLAEQNQPEKALSVYVVLSYGNMGNWTSGEGSFINKIIEIAGGKCVTEGVSPSWIEYSAEQLEASNPDLLLIANSMGDSTNVCNTVGYKSLKAVSDGQVYTVNDDELFRPGPRIAKAIADISAIIQKAAKLAEAS